MENGSIREEDARKGADAQDDAERKDHWLVGVCVSEPESFGRGMRSQKKWGISELAQKVS